MKLILCGDIVPTAVTVPAFDASDLNALMGDALDVLRSGDFTVGNLECALTNGEERIRKCGPHLKGRPEYAKVLRECGFTHLGLSNNHAMDYGIPGFRDTVSALVDAGITPFGYGENDQDSRRALYLTKDGLTVAIVAVCEHEYSYALPNRFGANPFDPFDTMDDIRNARAHSDRVVVMYHGGKEQCEVPSPRLRKACRAMIRAGADLVLTQHSHCIGSRESYEGGEILYGQGNFNFVGHIDHPHWHSGLMCVLTATKTDMHVEYLPVVTTETGITLAHDDEKSAILEAFRARSRAICDEQEALRLWEAFCTADKQSYYLTCVRNGFIDESDPTGFDQLFPHYLDCEAHLDVWQTLFKSWHRT